MANLCFSAASVRRATRARSTGNATWTVETGGLSSMVAGAGGAARVNSTSAEDSKPRAAYRPNAPAPSSSTPNRRSSKKASGVLLEKTASRRTRQRLARESVRREYRRARLPMVSCAAVGHVFVVRGILRTDRPALSGVWATRSAPVRAALGALF